MTVARTVHNIVERNYNRDENLNVDFFSDGAVKQSQLGNVTQK